VIAQQTISTCSELHVGIARKLHIRPEAVIPLMFEIPLLSRSSVPRTSGGSTKVSPRKTGALSQPSSRTFLALAWQQHQQKKPSYYAKSLLRTLYSMMVVKILHHSHHALEKSLALLPSQ